jgi:hypothetical protein
VAGECETGRQNTKFHARVLSNIDQHFLNKLAVPDSSGGPGFGGHYKYDSLRIVLVMPSNTGPTAAVWNSKLVQKVCDITRAWEIQ